MITLKKKLINEIYNNAILKEIYTFSHNILIKSVRMGMSSLWTGFKEKHTCQSYTCYDIFINSKIKDMVNELIFSKSGFDVSISFSAINSSIKIPSNYKTAKAMDILDEKDLKKMKIVFIGRFPRAQKWKTMGYNVTVVELYPSKDEISWKECGPILKNCDIIFITGISLLNDTFIPIIEKSKKAKIKVLMGPTVPPSPLFFEYGINIVGSTVITNEKQAIHYWQHGGAGMRKSPKGTVKNINLINFKSSIR